MHPLDGPRAKVDRADEQLTKLEKVLVETNTTKPYGIVGELDSDGQRYTYRIVVHDASAIQRIKILTGEIVYHLRSALDHFAWQAARVHVTQPLPTVQFPIFTEEPTSDRRLKRFEGNLAGIRDPARQIIMDLQPFKPNNRGTDARLNRLAVLNELNIIDKHHSLNPVSVNTRMPILPMIEIFGPKNFDDGEIVAKIPAIFDPKQVFEPYFAFAVALPIRIGGGQEGIVALREIHNYVRDDVLPRFALAFP
jgi:hypothetical protein